jgi:exonuclease III
MLHFAGVVTYVKEDLSPLDAAADKLPGDANAIEDLCREGRIVETDHGSFVLVNVYVPNAGDREEGRPRLDFKIRFLQSLQQKCKRCFCIQESALWKITLRQDFKSKIRTTSVPIF